MESPPRLPKSKRPRASKSPDGSDSDTKKRGRPRVDKQDESAADRRRTQIRMAQRAYRQRKESTLDDLRKRVSQLHNTMELMNKAFVECRDRLVDAGLPPAQLAHVQDASDQLDTLMRDARNPADEQQLEMLGRPIQPLHKSLPLQPQTIEMPEVKNVPSWLDQNAVAQSMRPKPRRLDVGLGYSIYPPDADDFDSVPVDYFNYEKSTNGDVPPPVSKEASQQLSAGDLNAISPTTPDHTLVATLSSPITYSFQETSIARRLHRACIESGYQLLLDPSRRPGTYERVFRCSLLGRDRNKLAASFKSVLSRGINESLDFWEAPLIHIGGAGTHYPRRDTEGNLLPVKETRHVGLVGPQTLALLENAARDGLSTDMTVELAGFEGEWLDPYDVQGYLEEKGIFIDPSSSFAEAEIVEWDSSPAADTISTAPSIADPLTPSGNEKMSAVQQQQQQQRMLPYDVEQFYRLTMAGADRNQWNQNMNITGVGYSDAQTGSWLNFLPGSNWTKASANTAPSMDGPGVTMNGFSNGHDMEWNSTSIARGTDLASLDEGMHSNHRHQQSTAMPGYSQPPTPKMRKRAVIIDIGKFISALIVTGVCLGRSPGFRRLSVDHALAMASFDTGY